MFEDMTQNVNVVASFGSVWPKCVHPLVEALYPRSVTVYSLCPLKKRKKKKEKKNNLKNKTREKRKEKEQNQDN